ncbi:hypothetical protein CTEN210_12421 [Chaetoceros tenuissimus]|uniref:Uncharacterized protein n=1 Tax=Chaetoceros tenuissimus TaxID=426638 RepID=A0AAD3D3N2_9STRA|nr:hypothetical protein CTEN210_12421 [Chaetoceros tenuissimus]
MLLCNFGEKLIIAEIINSCPLPSLVVKFLEILAMVSFSKSATKYMLVNSILISAVRSSSSFSITKASKTMSKSSIFSRFGGFNFCNKSTNLAATRSLSTSEQYTEDAIGMAKKFNFDQFESLLTTGGDDRSLILPESGANKYHIRPVPIESHQIFRGSCTGNPPTKSAFEATKKFYEENLESIQSCQLDSALRDIFKEQRERLKKYLDLPEGAEVIIAPSGSDAEYLPIAIAKALHPDKKIVNGVTQLNEIGAGTAPASTGKFFSKYAPFLGDHGLDYLEGFDGIEGIVVGARNKDGSVVDAAQKMDEFEKEQIALGNYPIVHAVFGGKTGLRDTVMPSSIDKGDTSMAIVDACQGRFTLAEMKEWMDNDAIVLFTASKFFQAPPFCAAVIIPPSIAEKLSTADAPKEMLGANGLLGFVTDKELPSCMDSWKPYLNDDAINNVGLALRWQAGLYSMEKLESISDDERTALVDEWAAKVKNMVEENPNIDLFCVERSITSIRMAKDGDTSQWLNMGEARDLFRWMSLDVSEVVPDATEEEKKALATSGFIGQPVSVSEDFAIVRIALGVDSLYAYSQDKASTLAEDQMLVNKLGAIAKHFSTLKASGL